MSIASLTLLLALPLQTWSTPPAHDAAVEAAVGWLHEARRGDAWEEGRLLYGGAATALALHALERSGAPLRQDVDARVLEALLAEDTRGAFAATCQLQLARTRADAGPGEDLRGTLRAALLVDEEALWEDPAGGSALTHSFLVLRGCLAARDLGLEVPTARIASFLDAMKDRAAKDGSFGGREETGVAVAALLLARALADEDDVALATTLLTRAHATLYVEEEDAPAPLRSLEPWGFPLALAEARLVADRYGYQLGPAHPADATRDYGALFGAQKIDGSWGQGPQGSVMTTARVLLLLAEHRELEPVAPDPDCLRVRSFAVAGPMTPREATRRQREWTQVQLAPDGWGSLEAALGTLAGAEEARAARDEDVAWVLRCRVRVPAGAPASTVHLWVAADEGWELAVDGVLHARMQPGGDLDRPRRVPLLLEPGEHLLRFTIADREAPAAFGLQLSDRGGAPLDPARLQAVEE